MLSAECRVLCAVCCVQLVFGAMGYSGWVGLSAAEARKQAAPFREELKDAWARMKRAQPEQQDWDRNDRKHRHRNL